MFIGSTINTMYTDSTGKRNEYHGTLENERVIPNKGRLLLVKLDNGEYRSLYYKNCEELTEASPCCDAPISDYGICTRCHDHA
jgi:hypothetical protein